jgi:hypothetical protein
MKAQGIPDFPPNPEYIDTVEGLSYVSLEAL